MAIVANLAGTTPIDVKYATPNRTAATNAAVMALTPLYPGEIVVTADNGLWFRGLAPTAGSWGQVYASK